MAQENTARKDTSMDDILSSIRRIIDESEARKVDMPEVDIPDGPSAPANDVAPSVAQKTNAALTKLSLSAADDAASLQSVLAQLDAEIKTNAVPKSETVEVAADDSIRAAKYEARFSEEDSRAFATLGDVLAEQASIPTDASPFVMEPAKGQDAEPEAPAKQSVAVFEPTAEYLQVLVSEPVERAVAHSFGSLEEVLSRHSEQSLTEITQGMLKPMLQDWLDENLPSMVERMVRGEIERIARGEPRQS